MGLTLCNENGEINTPIGVAGCKNVDLLSFMSLGDIGGNNTNDIWGWTDELTGKEYVTVGKTNGTAFVDVSDPINPIYLGDLKTKSTQSVWRDIKICDNYAYIGSEATNHGVQVFDLRKLRGIEYGTSFEADVIYDSEGTIDLPFFGIPYFSKSHNLVINEETKFLYGVGGEPEGLNIVDISNPLLPKPHGIGVWADGYVHDAQSVVYHGPDNRYVGKEIVFGSNEKWFSIMDLTNKQNPTVISTLSYSNYAYVHQGWLTEDHRFFITNDEKDELDGIVSNTTTYIFNVENLEKPYLTQTYSSTETSVDHNLYTRDKILYQSNYKSGLRLLDLSDIESDNVNQIGYFDVPTGNVSLFSSGSWSNYPYFKSGVVVLTDIQNGVWIVKPRYLSVTASTENLCYGDNLTIDLTCLVKIDNVSIENLPETVDFNYTINERSSNITIDPFPEIDNETYNFTVVINNTYRNDLIVTVSNC